MKKDKEVFGLFITDIHLSKDNGQLVKFLFKQVFNICKERSISKIFCGGDVFTNRVGQPLSCLDDFKEIVDSLVKAKLNFYTIPGNHDKTDPESVKSYLDHFYSPNYSLSREGEVHFFSPNIVVAMIPYFPDERWMEEYRKVEEIVKEEAKPNSIKILITHSGFDGVMNNDGSKVESIIKPSMFKDWTRVLIGHYHNASTLSKNVIYTGSICQKDFGETWKDKGATIIYTDGSLEHIPLKFPKYLKETLDVNDTETLRALLEKYDGNEEDHIRFIFTGKKCDATKIDTAELSKRGIEAKFKADETEEAINSSESETMMCYDKKSIQKDFVKFCSENSIKGKHLKYGLKLIKEL